MLHIQQISPVWRVWPRNYTPHEETEEPKTLVKVNTSLASWVIRHMWQTAHMQCTCRVHTSGSIQYIDIYKYSSLILSIGLHVRGSDQLLESRKGGGGGGVFHCTRGLMDCTITTAHSSMNDLSEIQSIKTQKEPILQLLVTGLCSNLLAIYLKIDSKP